LSRDLGGASVLIAGGSGGLGSALARALHGRGARIAVMGRHRDRLESIGVPATVIVGDIIHTSDCVRAVEVTLGAHGSLDGIVNAAGVVAFGPLVDIDDETLDRLLATNVLGPLRLMRAAIPHLSGGGFIANISAVVAESPVANMAAYSASKAALTAADVAIARELRRNKISLIDARPPHTETGLATRPISGAPPTLPTGLDPSAVADRIVAAIEADERDVPSSAFV
jgi:NAD(P)-dependent dehydrogenase (short-subunit alcohol dehydrogenase family)